MSDGELLLAEFAHDGTGNADVLEVEDYREEAVQIYNSGAALNYMCGSASKMHADDKPIIRTLFLSYASVFVRNCNGINVEITGSAGSGKTHITKVVLKHIPIYAQLKGKLSDKALFYHEFPTGTIFSFDDQDLSPDMQGTIKNLNWEEPTRLYTVKQQSKLVLEIPERCPYWNTKAEGAGDEQIQDRLLKFWADESEEHKARRDEMEARYLMHPEEKGKFDRSAKVSAEIWRIIKDAGVRNVVIPYADRITGGDGDARTKNLFTALIQASAIINAPVRGKTDDGSVIASADDLYEAIKIINPLMRNEGGSQSKKLNRNAMAVLDALKDKPSGDYSYDEIKTLAGGLTSSELSHALHGRSADKMDGLEVKCPAITVTQVSIKKYEYSTGITQSIMGKGVSWNKELYAAWIITGNDGFSIDGKPPAEMLLEMSKGMELTDREEEALYRAYLEEQNTAV